MFESAEVGHRISKEDYRAREAELREALLKAQYDLLGNAKFPVVIIIGGVDGAGKGRNGQPAQRMDGSAPHRHLRLWRNVG